MTWKTLVSVVSLVVLSSNIAWGQKTGPFLDRFEDGELLDEYSWTGAVAETGGELILAPPDPAEAVLTFDETQRIVPAGDYEVRVHYRFDSLSTPPNGTVAAGLWVRGVSSGNVLAAIDRARDSAGNDVYRGWAGTPSGAVTTPTTDTEGWLRVKSAGFNYIVSRWLTSAWGIVAVIPNPSGEDVKVQIDVAGLATAPIVAFDDLSVLLPSDVCPWSNASLLELGRELVVDVGLDRATTESFEPDFSCAVNGPQPGFGTNWYRFTAGSPTVRVATLAAPTSPSINGFDSLLAVYNQYCPPASGLTEIACNDDTDLAGGVLLSCADATGLTPGSTYHAEVASWQAVMDQRLEAILVATSPVLYVDAAAPAGGDGQSWTTAFNNPQGALTVARLNDLTGCPIIDEIRIAQGTYRPDGSTGQIANGNYVIGDGDALKAFTLVSGLTVFGGYRGAYDGTGLLPDDRDIAAFETILDGDLSDNDDFSGFPAVAGMDENTLTVVLANSVIACTLDGVTISGGGDPINFAALFVRAGSVLAIQSCTFRENRGFFGGGALVLVATATFDQCLFTRNIAANAGGGLNINSYGAATCRDCLFDDNRAVGSGGGVGIIAADQALFERCTFTNNATTDGVGDAGGAVGVIRVQSMSGPVQIVECEVGPGNVATFGGGISIGGTATDFTTADIVSSTILSNTATANGGGIYAALSAAVNVKNSLIAGNTAGTDGGAIYATEFAPAVTDVTVLCSTLADNQAASGGGIAFYGTTLTVDDSIAWGNTNGDVIAPLPGSTFVPANSIFGEAASWGGTNVWAVDPRFADPDGPDNNPLTIADNDYSLGSGSPAIDAGDNVSVPADMHDLDGDGDTTEPLPLDYAGNPRFADDVGVIDTGSGDAPPIVDIGAFEHQNHSCAGLVLYDHFNNGILDPTWSVAMDPGVSWVASEMGTLFEVTDIIGAPEPGAGGALIRTISPQGDFDFEARISWTSEGVTGLEAMQQLIIGLYGGGAKVAEVSFIDAWLGSTGGFWVTAGNNTVGQGPAMAASAGDATILISRVNGVVVVQAIPVGTASITVTGASTVDVDRIQIAFVHHGFAGAVFGSESVDLVQLVSGTMLDCNGNGIHDECDLPGDFDGNGSVDVEDIPPFVNMLLTGQPAECIVLADTWIDGTADGLDIAPFIEAVLMP